MQLTRVSKAPPLGIQAYANLKDAIICGHIQPGHRLTEEKVAEFLGVSRTPAREALRLLGQEGVVDRRESGGFIVPIPSLEKVTRITEVRKLLEPHAAKLAAARITAEEIDHLRRSIDREWQVIEDMSPGVFVSANCAVRNLLYELSGNEQLIDCIGRYSDHLQFIGTRTLTDIPVRKIAASGHERIFDAISSHDAEGAATAVELQIDAAQLAAKNALSE
jgi:DNA-binding GntR family transcriptional regulator